MREDNQWSDYPMGPSLRSYLHISEDMYQGEKAPRPSEERAHRFSLALIDIFQQQPIDSFSEWVAVLEELTAMGLSQPALFLAEEDFREQANEDFRSMLAIGCSYMLAQNYSAACSFLEKAQAIEPAETATYVNIARIHYSHSADEKALIWAKAGLDVDPNNESLWEILASVYIAREKQTAGEALRQDAQDRNSFMGLSLAAEIVSPNDALLKAQWLELLCDTPAEQNPQFLVEYSAVLGMAGHYEKIPALALKAEKLVDGALPWQLYAHAVQAHVAMEKLEAAQALFGKLEKSQEIPAETLNAIKAEIKDLEESRASH